MAKYCWNCGSEVDENAVICTKCGCELKSRNSEESSGAYNASVALGILGIIFSWFAIAGHILSIIGIITGIKGYRATSRTAGLTLSIIGEICAVCSSMIGIAISASLF